MSDARDPSQRDVVKEAHAALLGTTPGPWRAGTHDRVRLWAPHPTGIGGSAGERCVLVMNEHFDYAADISFIAASRDLVAGLLARLGRAERALAAAGIPRPAAPTTFIERAVDGEFADVDDAFHRAIGDWHDVNRHLRAGMQYPPAHDHLGMTAAEFAHVGTSAGLLRVVAARRAAR